MVGNQERLVALSPKAIGDLLVNNSYDFIRPEIARVQLSKVTGEGLLVAEGDVHKVFLFQISWGNKRERAREKGCLCFHRCNAKA